MTLRWLTATALVLATLAPALAHVGSRIYPVFDVSPPYAPDLDDGSVADWEDIAYDATATSLDFASLAVGDGGSLAPDDLALRMFLGCNDADGRIYFALQRFDDVYVNEYDGTGGQSMWRHDNVEIMIDGDHSGGPYNGYSADSFSDEELKRLVNAQAQHYVAIVESPDGQLLWNLGAGDAWVSRPPWAEVGGFVVDESPHYSLIEGAVTAWDDLSWEGPSFSRRSVLEAGRIIGFQISVADFDTDPGAYHGFHVLEGQESTWRLAERFVDGQLLCTGCDASQVVSAVRVDSWGRIKASLRLERP